MHKSVEDKLKEFEKSKDLAQKIEILSKELDDLECDHEPTLMFRDNDLSFIIPNISTLCRGNIAVIVNQFDIILPEKEVFIEQMDDGGVSIDLENEEERRELLFVLNKSGTKIYFSASESKSGKKYNGIVSEYKTEAIKNLLNWVKRKDEDLILRGLELP